MGKKLVIGLLVGSVLLLALGLTMRFVYPVIYNNMASLVEGSPVYEKWVEPDYPIYMKYHFFTYNNSREFIAGEDPKPIVEYAGILSYREYQEKYDIEYESDDKKVKYYNNKWYVFDDETSSMAENDTVIVPNILMFTIMETAEKLGLASVAAIEINLMYKSENFTESNAASPFYEVEAADLLWGLYPNALLELEALSVLVGDNTKFGLQVNNTNDGLYEIYTGKGDSNENRGVVDQWNNASHLTYWYNETCNMINGTDGTIYPTDVAKDDRLYIFNTQICRSIFLISDKDEDVNGVSTTKYVAPSVVFEVDFEDNVCFCENADYSNCLGDGLLDVSQCYQELIQQQMGLSTPLYLSLVVSSPEFLYADNYTIDSIVNFDPNPEHHETYLNLDLDSGIILTGAKRIQLNTYIKQYWGTSFFSKGPLLDSMENLPEGWKYLIPLFWGEEVLPEDDSLVGSVKQSERVTIAVLVLSYISIGVGVVLLIAAIALVFYSSTIRKSADNKTITVA